MVANLTRDVEVRYTQQGTPVATLGLACNRSYKPDGATEYKKDTCFINAVIWGKRAENCAQQLHKGNPVFITGRLQSRSWEKDNVKHFAVEIVVDNIQLFNKTGEGTTLPEEG
jgi:single-strand DNA-binding protein